jgi:hypothetical protein
MVNQVVRMKSLAFEKKLTSSLQEHLNMFIPRYKKKNVANEIV